jgi:FixJ family two-component response regulator
MIMNEKSPVVCVVDDESLMRDSLRNLFRSVGLKVQTFASAQEFLNNSFSEAPSCLVLDVQMPGTSGLELQRELGDRESGVPIIFMTGHGNIPMSVRAMKAGAFEFLTKPCRDEDLLRAVNQAIERGPRIEQLKDRPTEGRTCGVSLSRNGSDPASIERMEIRRREREDLFAVLQKAGWKIKAADGAAELFGY